MKKVLHVIWSGNIGGAEVLLLNTLKKMTSECDEKQVFRHYLCILRNEGPLVSDFRNLGIPIVCFHAKNGLDLKMLLQLSNHIKKYKFDIVHLHSSLFPAPIVKLFSKAKVVRTEHGGRMINQRGMKRWSDLIIAKILDLWIDCHIAISEFVKIKLEQNYRISNKKIHVIYNGIEPLTVNKNVQHKHKLFTVGFIGRLIPEKGVHLLLEAAADILSSNHHIQFIIVGDGPGRKEFEKQAIDMCISTHVQFLGNRKDRLEILEKFNLFCFTSIWEEPFGMTILEAMNTGVPVVAFKGGAVSEIITHEHNGWIIEPNPIHLSKTIQHFMNHPENLEKLKTEAHHTIQNHFSLQQMVYRTIQLYKRLLG